MKLKQLSYIIAIDTHKQFSEAAYSCGVTQATLSAMVIKLEGELGFQIFDRTTKPVTTTELGLALIAKAKKVEALTSSIYDIGKSVPTFLSGALTLGILPTIANSLLSRVLPELLQANPKLRLQVKEITTEEMIRSLQRGTIDIGIAATPLHAASIVEEHLYYEPMLVYGVEKIDTKYRISESLLEEKVWLLEEGHCFRKQVATVCDLQKKSNDLENLSFEGNSFETLFSMVDSFGGYTLIPELYYLDMDTATQAKTHPFQKPIPVREIGIVSYGPSRKQPTTQYLCNFIQQRIRPLLSTANYTKEEIKIIGIQ